jgi:hypothetical protein
MVQHEKVTHAAEAACCACSMKARAATLDSQHSHAEQ